MEEDEAEESNHDHYGEDDDLLELLEDKNESGSDDFVSVSEEDSDENNYVVMEDVNDAIAKGQRAADHHGPSQCQVTIFKGNSQIWKCIMIEV